MSQEYIITIAENHKLSLDIAVKRANNWDFRKIIGGTNERYQTWSEFGFDLSTNKISS